MSSDFQEKALKGLKTAWGYTKIFTLNSWRRVLLLGRYTLICWQAQQLRRARRFLGTQVLKALERGEVNPMLTAEVKDALKKARDLAEVKERHYQAIAALREKIRTACSCEFPSKGIGG